MSFMRRGSNIAVSQLLFNQICVTLLLQYSINCPVAKDLRHNHVKREMQMLHEV